MPNPIAVSSTPPRINVGPQATDTSSGGGQWWRGGQFGPPVIWKNWVAYPQDVGHHILVLGGRTGTPKQVLIIDPPELAEGILAELSTSGDQFVLTDVATGIFGVGATAHEAVTDFLAALGEHADVLARQEALSPELYAQLEYLRQHLAI